MIFAWDSPCHGLWNAVKAALRAVHWYAEFLQALVLFNWKAGPWTKDVFGKKTWEAAQHALLSLKNNPRDRLLKHLWPGYKRDYQLRVPWANFDEAKEEVW